MGYDEFTALGTYDKMNLENEEGFLSPELRGQLWRQNY